MTVRKGSTVFVRWHHNHIEEPVEAPVRSAGKKRIVVETGLWGAHPFNAEKNSHGTHLSLRTGGLAMWESLREMRKSDWAYLHADRVAAELRTAPADIVLSAARELGLLGVMGINPWAREDKPTWFRLSEELLERVASPCAARNPDLEWQTRLALSHANERLRRWLLVDDFVVTVAFRSERQPDGSPVWPPCVVDLTASGTSRRTKSWLTALGYQQQYP